MVNAGELLKDIVSELPGAMIVHKDEWGADTFLVGGKIFAMNGTNKTGQTILTVKGLPSDNEELVELNTAISPGYYMNKTHWISILLEDESIGAPIIEKCLKQSYQLIYDKLTKKMKAEINEG